MKEDGVVCVYVVRIKVRGLQFGREARESVMQVTHEDQG